MPTLRAGFTALEGPKRAALAARVAGTPVAARRAKRAEYYRKPPNDVQRVTSLKPGLCFQAQQAGKCGGDTGSTGLFRLGQRAERSVSTAAAGGGDSHRPRD